MTVSRARSQCAEALAQAGARCRIGAFGPIGAFAGRAFFYARYDMNPVPGDPAKPLPYSRIVIFEGAPSAMLRPMLISGDDAAFIYGKPKILHSGGRILLHIPAVEDGTGNFNRELLYAWEEDGWHDIDVVTWLDDLARRLPKGLGALKGVFPDYATMTAGTPVWYATTDSNACPTAGHVDISLAWSGDRLVIAGLRIRRSKQALDGEGCFE